MARPTIRRIILEGLRPFDPYRDIKAVTDLITLAFGDRLDAAGQLALAQMRRVARRRAVMRWFYGPGWEHVGTAPSGFVWVERGRVVGNVSLRRALESGGFLIGNVCVHPHWRRHGIARGLVGAALRDVSTRGGRWVGLEVRADNPEAQQLYERMGFREEGRTLRMLRPAGLPWEISEQPPSEFALRRARSRDSGALFGLVRATVPAPLHSLLELRRADYAVGWERTVDSWLAGKRESWWLAENGGEVCGAVRVLRERRRAADRLEVLVKAEYAGRLARGLLARPLATLARSRTKIVEAVLLSYAEALADTMEQVGFRRSHVLIQMRLNLGLATAVRRA